MTMPNERTRALIWAGEFIQDLLNFEIYPDLPERIKGQAAVILRHYPSLSEIESLAKRDEQANNNDIQSPLLCSEQVRKSVGAIKHNTKNLVIS
jgi:hypothetical protein